MFARDVSLFRGGRILTLDPERPEAEALAVVDGRIAAVGGEDEVAAAVGPGARRVSLEGGTLLPGFVDGHSHFPSGGMNRLYAADLAVADLPALRAALAVRLAENRRTGREWLVGHGFDDKAMREPRFPTREDLDAVADDVPIFLRHVTGHSGVANTRALQLAGITDATPNPPGGVIARDAAGRATGVLDGIPAQSLVRRLIPPFTTAEMKAAVADDGRVYAACGITTAQGGPAFSPMDAELGEAVTGIMLDCAKDRTLPVRVVLFIRAVPADRLSPYPYHVAGADLSGDGRVILGAAKLWADGDPRTGTGHFSEPYAHLDADKGPGYRGEFLYGREELLNMLLPIHRAGWQIAVHANGDAAIETVITACEGLRRLHPRPDARHMVIHCQYPSRGQLRRMAAGGLQPCFFISPLRHWGEIHARYAGRDRMERFCPCAEAEALGLRYNLHSDAPITPVSPLALAAAAVTRTSLAGNVYGASQAVSVLSALRAVTLWPAFHNFEEHRKGSLTPGKYADMVLLDAHPLHVSPEDLADIAVLKTWVAGEEVFSR